MGAVLESISPELQSFIESQKLFFVATAPIEVTGHINLSPKGIDTFRVLSPTRVAYLDLTGSGNETAAHVTQNGRITVMFCAFEGKPMILRLYGHGRAVLPGVDGWDALAPSFSTLPGTRQIIVINVTRVQTSCGFAVPVMRYEETRDTLLRWAETKGLDGLRAYRELKNRASIDGIPAPHSE
jgi:hypothetical protein